MHQALDAGRLIIDPEPLPRTGTENSSVKCPYQTSAVDLRLGDEVSYFTEGLPINIDLRRGSFASLFGPNSSAHKITAETPFALEPQKFVLSTTFERVSLPLIQDQIPLAARVEGRSSYARCGLLIHFTAPTIHAGYNGRITLELINLGPLPILLYPGAPICQLIVEEVHGDPFRNDSQFQGQITAGGSKK